MPNNRLQLMQKPLRAYSQLRGGVNVCSVAKPACQTDPQIKTIN